MNVYQGRQVRKGNKVYKFDELVFIFNCPTCEYVMTARTRDEARTIEAAHCRIALSTHLDTLADARWEQSPLSRIALTKEHDASIDD